MKPERERERERSLGTGLQPNQKRTKREQGTGKVYFGATNQDDDKQPPHLENSS